MSYLVMVRWIDQDADDLEIRFMGPFLKQNQAERAANVIKKFCETRVRHVPEQWRHDVGYTVQVLPFHTSVEVKAWLKGIEEEYH